MSIIESTPPTRVVVKVDFVKPFAAHNLNELILGPMSGPGPSTRVTWTMQGSNLYVMRVMSIFVNMDRVMGKHFETGLNHLKQAAENRPCALHDEDCPTGGVFSRGGAMTAHPDAKR
jgi:hypothetical protein